MKNNTLVRREVPEKLKYGLEILLQRDDITPHIWEREKHDEYILDEYGKIYCSTYLSDEEWIEYLKFAACEIVRMESTCMSIPVVPEHFKNGKMVEEACRRLGSENAFLEEPDQRPVFENDIEE